MTVSSETNSVAYTGNGVTTAFAYAFPFLAAADLVVIETVIATGVQTTKTLTTHYTVSGTPDALGHYPNGGTVNAVTAPASTVTWTIFNDPDITQNLDLVENDPMPAESLEAAFDRLTMICQRIAKRLARALRQPDGDTADIGTLPAKVDRASKYMAFDADGEPVATAGTSSDLIATAFIETLLDDANAAAARATLGVTLASQAETNTGTASDRVVTPETLAGSRHCFLAHKNGTDQTGILSATETKITFPTEDFDTGAHYDAANSKFIPTLAGKYRLSATVQVDPTNVVDGSGAFIRLFKNGVLHRESVSISAAAATAFSTQVTAIVDANGSTDYFEIYVSILGAGNKIVEGTASATWFCGERI